MSDPTPTPDTAAPTGHDLRHECFTIAADTWRKMRQLPLQDHEDEHERAVVALIVGKVLDRVAAARSVAGTAAREDDDVVVEVRPDLSRLAAVLDRLKGQPYVFGAGRSSGTAALTEDTLQARLAQAEWDRDEAREEWAKAAREVERLTGFLHRAGFEVCTSCSGIGGTATVDEVNPCGDCNGFCIVPIEEDGDE